MKTKHSFFAIILTIVFTLSLCCRSVDNDKTAANTKKQEMSGMMGSPSVDTTVGGIHMKVWLMTQKKHKKMMKEMKGHMMMEGEEMKEEMKGMKHDDMKMDKAEKEAMMAGTHHIMLDAKYSSNGKSISNANAAIRIVYPSKKITLIDLKPMMSHFGESLTLDEKGEYQFTVSVNDSGFTREKRFNYKVK